jgi:hypothetical protein
MQLAERILLLPILEGQLFKTKKSLPIFARQAFILCGVRRLDAAFYSHQSKSVLTAITPNSNAKLRRAAALQI